MVRLERFAERSQDALQYVHELGQSHNNSQIEVEHLLIAETSKSITAENEETIYREMRSGVLDLLRKSLKPEFLNRIDERIVFRSLSLENIRDFVDLLFKEVAQRLTEQDIHASLTGQARDHLARVGVDPAFGVRPLRRIIQRFIIQPLANEMLKGRFKPGDKVTVDVKDDNIVFV